VPPPATGRVHSHRSVPSDRPWPRGGRASSRRAAVTLMSTRDEYDGDGSRACFEDRLASRRKRERSYHAENKSPPREADPPSHEEGQDVSAPGASAIVRDLGERRTRCGSACVETQRSQAQCDDREGDGLCATDAPQRFVTTSSMVRTWRAVVRITAHTVSHHRRNGAGRAVRSAPPASRRQHSAGAGGRSQGRNVVRPQLRSSDDAHDLEPAASHHGKYTPADAL